MRKFRRVEEEGWENVLGGVWLPRQSKPQPRPPACFRQSLLSQTLSQILAIQNRADTSHQQNRKSFTSTKSFQIVANNAVA